MTSESKPPTHNSELREEMVRLLEGGGAHATFEDAIEGFPAALAGKTVPNVAHTPWEILEHLRLAQWDILEYCRNPNHKSPKWPEGYWPTESTPPHPGAWAKSVRDFLENRGALIAWVRDPSIDLFAPVPDDEGPTLLHQLVITAQHNSYHLGQLLLLRRAIER